MGAHDLIGQYFLRLKEDVDGVTVWYGTYDPENVNVDEELEVKLYIDGKLFLHTDVITLLLFFLGHSGFSLPLEKVRLLVGGKEAQLKLREE